MEIFMPSEIARLVLGYLKEENCTETMKCFLSECFHLTEYNRMLEMGREYPTNVKDVSLKMLITEYGITKYGATNNHNNNNNIIIRSQSIFNTPSTGCPPVDVNSDQASPLVELVNIAGNMERQLNNLVLIHPSTGQGLGPHLISYTGRHSSGHQGRRNRRKVLNIMESNGNENGISKKTGKAVNASNDSVDVDDKKKPKKVSKGKGNNKLVFSKKPNITESYVLLEKLQDQSLSETNRNKLNNIVNNDQSGGNNIIGTNNNDAINNEAIMKGSKTTSKRKAVSRPTNRKITSRNIDDDKPIPEHALIPPESPLSVLNDEIIPPKLCVNIFPDSVKTTADNSKAMVVKGNELPDVPLPSMPSCGVMESEQTEVDTDQHDNDDDQHRCITKKQTEMSAAEFFANFDSAAVVEETTMEAFGAPLHNSTSLVCLGDAFAPETPINFNQDETLVIQSSSPDILQSQTFGSSFDGDLKTFDFPSRHFESLASSPIVDKRASPIRSRPAMISSWTPARSLKFRKLSHRLIAEHQREQNLKCSVSRKNVAPLRRIPSNNSNSISSTSEFKNSEGGRVVAGKNNQLPRRQDDYHNGDSMFSVCHIREIVNFSDDDDKTIEVPFERSDQEISSQIVSSSRLVGSPDYHKSPISCPSSTPLKRKIDEPVRPSPKKKKKDLKTMNIADFLSKIHR